MFRKRGHGQSWSLDIILAFVVFVLIVGIFYTLVGNNKEDKTRDLAIESKTVVSSLDTANGLNNELTLIEKGNIDPIKLESLYESNYSDIKKELGIRGEFCIYVVDQYGNLVTVDTTNGQVGSFGNGNFTVNNQPCGSRLS